MIVLALAGGFSHNAAACLIRDGQLLSMVEEERLTRQRFALGAFPVQAIDHCLTVNGIAWEDVDCLALSWDPNRLSDQSSVFADPAGILRAVCPPGVAAPPLRLVDHHLAHAASSYYCSGFDSANVIVIDGSGEDVAVSLFVAHSRGLDRVGAHDVTQSLGWMYEAVTEHVGLGDWRHAGKTMGLAAYAAEAYDLPYVHVDRHGYHVDLPFSQPASEITWSKRTWREVVDLHKAALTAMMHSSPAPLWSKLDRLRGESKLPFPQESVRLAASVQNKLESAVSALVRRLHDLSGLRQVCLAGGVALNCAMNGRLRELDVVDELFVPPAANDAGGAIGAGLLVAAEHSRARRPRLQHAYFGPAFTPRYISQYLDMIGIPYHAPTNLAEYTARLISAGKIVAWFQGAMEFGPRALGGRSILADPRSEKMRDRVNSIKGREWWRPLAPMITSDRAPLMFRGGTDSPFMLMAFDVNERYRDRLAAVVHVDGTTRPQTVTASQKNLWELLSHAEDCTGLPVLLNTSFNLAGEPIVCSPQDAVDSFLRSGLDALILENCVVERQIKKVY